MSHCEAVDGIDDLVAWLARGCKPRSQWRIGTEHEKIGFCLETLRPVPYEGERSIRSLLEMLQGEGWEPILEQDRLTGLRNGPASITLEPGGQLELSGAPLASIFDTCREVTDHLHMLRQATETLRIGFLALGFQPKWRRDEIPWMPKERYAIMRRYMPKVGRLGLDMMLRTATVQANLDFDSEVDMARKMRIGLALQPLVTAMFAASPFVDGRPNGYLSNRARAWLHTDPARTGVPACAFAPDFGFRAYAEWALDVPMYFIVRQGRYIDCTGESFRAFLQGRLPQAPGERPTLADWELHLSTLFPDVRLKQYLEMRGADAGPWPWICSLPALWKGLLYDEQACREAWALCSDWSHAEVVALRAEAARKALAATFRGRRVRDWCVDMLAIARAGLKRLAVCNESGEDERVFLRPIEQALATGQTQAERWLAAFEGSWQHNIDRIFFESAHP
ncbi:MAG: glutamate--cysteine ligase [Gammaproteobacteria bacterium]|nr:MAG: glutamate--cysteine ligase [Gammaproteobacteria bacterium]